MYYLLEELLEKVVVLEFNKPLKIGSEGLVLELYSAGHILDAAALWIQSRLGNVFMTSDYCLEHQHTVKGLEAANWEFVTIFYEEAKKTTDIDVLRKAIYNRLKHKKYMTEAVVRGLLEARFMKSHQALQNLHNYLNNNIKESARKLYRLDILHYTVELVSYF